MLFNNTNLRTAMTYTNAVGDKVYPVIVDIKKGIKSTEEILFVSSDINTGVLSVAFIQGNDTYNVTGAEVVCSIMRPDASTLDIPCTVIENNIVEVPLGVNGTSQDGVYSFDFKVFKGGDKIVGTPIMNYSVSLSISNDLVIEEDDRLPVLTMLITQVNELKEETRETVNQANIATEATKVATANAIEATNNVNAVINTANQKMVEVDNAKNEMTATVTNKVNEVENRFNALTASQQQSSEVIDARDGETSLKARLDRDIEKAKQVYVNVEGSHISTDSSSGYLKDVEILGNTIQDASNLADIRSVGDTVEGQELYEIPVLSCGKNLFNMNSPIKNLASYTTYECLNNVLTVKATNSTGNGYITFDDLCLKDGVEYTISFEAEGTVVNGEPWVQIVNGDGTHFNRYTISPITFLAKGQTSIRFYSNIGSGVTKTKIYKNIQLEEGTVATSYEPYQEDKLTILSPVQLEKVGDVADRIIEKDGVLVVEKNVNTVVLNGSESWRADPATDNMINMWFSCENIKANTIMLCDKFNYESLFNYKKDKECIGNNSNNVINLALAKSRLVTPDVQGFKQWLQNNNVLAKYQTTQPTFIPLPHDQQVKLRTFANKTNISFLTEIEGTIKAQVPKSLGATVNTHTEQISNLNKELDRVKKLEESTVSTVTTESDFTTVEATSNGYFEDVKLEGKTLVNLSTLKDKTLSNASNDERRLDFNTSMFKASTDYTLIMNVGNVVNGTKSLFVQWDFIDGSASKFNTINSNVSSLANSTVVFKFRQDVLPSKLKRVYLSLHIDDSTSCTCEIKDCIVLEGDHTQNPPSYFEGLKSVGQDVDEIVVSSGKSVIMETNSINPNDGQDITLSQRIRSVEYLEYNVKGIKLAGIDLSKYSVYYFLYDENKNYIRSSNDWVNSNCFKFSVDGKYYRFVLKGLDSVNLSPSDVNIIDTHQSDKKRLLYYNNETQTWEKPVLRKWDSIEKHSDGKYYYHQRSGEVVLNGSESWGISKTSENMLIIGITPNTSIKGNNDATCNICDKFISVGANFQWLNEIESVAINKDGQILIQISKSKLPTQDVQGFKQWLQANNVTVVYQLAQEKVYECTNIDLITYANETNYIVECGAIVPRSTLKVHNNISNVVKVLQEKVSLLENKFIEGLKQVLAGDMYSLAELLYPEDFVEENPENEIMLLPLE